MQVRKTILLIVGIFLLSLPLLAQTSKGIISGTITDSTGAAVPGATVTATSKDTGETRTVSSGPTGGYRIEAINPGTYKINVKQSGFKALDIDNVTVQASVITPLDGVLSAGGGETVVNVESTNSGVQTENAEISHNISTQEIISLPLNSLNPIQIVNTEPGVVDTNQNGRGTSNGFNFSVNGLSSRQNNFLLDGQDNNDNSIQGQAFQPQNPNAISEVSILTNAYSAEFGRGGSSVTNLIYKSGSNRFHGSAWELYAGSGLNAIASQDALGGIGTTAPKTRFDQHTFGFDFGGPVLKDKLFFYGTSQWQRFYGKAQPATLQLPTAAGAAVLQSLNSPNANLLLQYIGGLRGAVSANPADNPVVALGGGRPGVQFGLVQRPAPAQQSPDTQWDVKVDFIPSAKDTLSVRYLHDRTSLTPDFFNLPASLPGLDTFQGGPSENVVTAWTHTFNSRAVNELRASFGHFDFQFAPTAETLANPLYTLPRLTIAGMPGINRFPLLGVNAGIPQGRGHQTYQVQDGFTYTFGKHVMKYGGDVARLIIRDEIPFNFFGTATFTSGGGFTGLGNFVDNFSGQEATFASKTFGNPTVRPRALQTAYYVEDTWKTTPNLTLTMGLRYEFQPNPVNQLAFPGYNTSVGPFGTLTTPLKIKEDGNNFAPRVGVSYTPHFLQSIFGNNKTVLRAGYGIFYDTLYTNLLDNVAGSSPNAVAAPINGGAGRGLANATTSFGSFNPVLNPLSTQTSIASNLVNPLVHQWNANIQRELPWQMTMTVAYVGTRSERVFESDTFNPIDPNTKARINPGRGAITVRENTGDSIYHGGSVKLERRFSHGVLLRSAYTYSKAIDDGSDVFNAFGTGNSGSIAPQSVFQRGLERGASDFDVTHRWVTTYVWQIPGLRWEGNGFTKAVGFISRGWEVAGTTSLQSGAPASPFIAGFDTDGDGNALNNRPFIGNFAAPLTSVGIDGRFVGLTPGTIYNMSDLNSSDINVANNPRTGTANDFHFLVLPGKGNAARNSLREPGSWLQDLAVTKHVKVPGWERQELQFRGEFYNIFNHPNFDNTFGFNSDVTSAGAGYLDKLQAAQGGRTIKLMMKYTF